MTAMSCRMARGAIARDDAEPSLRALIARHLRECPDCRAHEGHRAEVRDGVLAADDVLDDVTRAQVLARVLEARRRERAGDRSERSAGRLNARLWLGALAVSAAVVVAVAAVPRPKQAGPVVAQAPSLAALEPYAIHAASAEGVSGGRVDRVELPAGASMRARLRPSADLLLLGPLAVTVRDADDKRVRLELRLGTLIGDFDGASGRTLRIATPDATIEIVGTRFLVEASPERTRVAVEHGRVRVESRGRVRLVSARQEWSTDRDEVEPLGARGTALFERAARGDLEELTPEASVAARVETHLEAPKRRRAQPEIGRSNELPAAAPLPAPPVAEAATESPVAPDTTHEETASSLYRRAESALGRGDGATGKKLLEELVRLFPGEDSARYELALMAEKAGNASEALAQTREILRPGARGSLVEPAKFLRCRVYLGQDKGNAALCLTDFVEGYPQSPHDEVALRALIDLAREGGRCAEAKRFAETYLQRHPRGRFVAEAERAQRRCE